MTTVSSNNEIFVCYLPFEQMHLHLAGLDTGVSIYADTSLCRGAYHLLKN